MSVRFRIRVVGVASSGLKRGFGQKATPSSSKSKSKMKSKSFTKQNEKEKKAVRVPDFSLPLTIRKYPDPVLRSPAETVDVRSAPRVMGRVKKKDENLVKLTDEMFR